MATFGSHPVPSVSLNQLNDVSYLHRPTMILRFRRVNVPPRPTPGITRRAYNLETTQVSRMTSTLFAVSFMALLGRGIKIFIRLYYDAVFHLDVALAFFRVPENTLYPSFSSR